MGVWEGVKAGILRPGVPYSVGCVPPVASPESHRALCSTHGVCKSCGNQDVGVASGIFHEWFRTPVMSSTTWDHRVDENTHD